MATSTKKVLRMSFNTSLGGAMTITLPDPKAGITAAEIEAVMDQIIAKDIFLTSGGALLSKRDVKIVNTTTDDLFDQPAL
jgi:hypothetical protein